MRYTVQLLLNLSSEKLHGFISNIKTSIYSYSPACNLNSPRCRVVHRTLVQHPYRVLLMRRVGTASAQPSCKHTADM